MVGINPTRQAANASANIDKYQQEVVENNKLYQDAILGKNNIGMGALRQKMFEAKASIGFQRQRFLTWLQETIQDQKATLEALGLGKDKANNVAYIASI